MMFHRSRGVPEDDCPFTSCPPGQDMLTDFTSVTCMDGGEEERERGVCGESVGKWK